MGRYFFPAFAGVALSRNEFRWSPRIKREDGLIRLVPGLGHARRGPRPATTTRCWSRPGQPGLRVNVTPDEVVRYSPQQIDVIDLEARSLKTLRDPDAACGVRPANTRSSTASSRSSTTRRIVKPAGHVRRPRARRAGGDLRRADLGHARSCGRIGAMLRTCCEESARSPGRHRVRLRRARLLPAPVPPAELRARERRGRRSRATCRTRSILFSANRYVSNGQDARHHPHRLRRPGPLQRARERRRPARGRARRQPAQHGAAQAPVHPDGPGALGEPRRHQARRQRHLLGHQQHRDARRDRAQARQLRARSLVRHALLPGPGRGRRSATCRSTPTTRASCSTSASSASRRTSWRTWRRSSPHLAERRARHRRARRRAAAWCCGCS